MKYFLIALAAALSGCAGRGVVVSGWAPLGPDGPEGARRRALVQAQKAAVEHETGVALSARLRVKDGRAVEQSLTSRSAGRVGRFELLSEGPLDGGWVAKIRAFVERGAPPPPVEVALAPGLPAGLAAGTREGLRRGGVAVAQDAELELDGGAEQERAPDAAGWPAWRARVRLVARRSGEIVAEARAEASAARPSEAGAKEDAAALAARVCAEKLAAELARL